MKKLLIFLGAVVIAGCGVDTLKVIHNNDRVAELERRANLNDELDAVQNQRLDALEAAMNAEIAARQAADQALDAALQQEMADRASGDAALQALLDAEVAAREAGDLALSGDLSVEIANRIAGDTANRRALRRAVFLQAIRNHSLQSQIDRLRQRIHLVGLRVGHLQSRVNNLEDRVDDLESEMAQVKVDMATLEADLQGQIDDLAADQAATQAQLDQEGVKVFKCNSPSSTERIIKINGKFYAVMNRVTTKSVQVITGSSSTSFTTPNLCETFSGDLKLPNSGGICTPVSGPFKSTLIPGTTVVVPSYSTANQTVVTSVKMAMDILVDGSYQTTDGGPACNFSISGGGTVSSNLIPVQ